MTKNRFLLTLSLLISLFQMAAAQNFYEITWTTDNVKYTALVSFYSDDETYVRVKYTIGGKYTVASYNCKSSFKTSTSGIQYYLMDGSEGKVVYGGNGNGYNADNFYFWDLDKENHFKKIYVIDDGQLSKTNYQDYFKIAEYKQLNPKDFTETYLYGFYEKTEPEYSKFLNLAKNQSEPYLKYAINSLFYANSNWIVTAAEGSGLYHQHYKVDSEYPYDFITTNWADNYYITSLNGNADKWAVVMSKGTGYTNQAYKRSATAPYDWIKEKWDKGYEITSVGWAKGEWCYVMSENSQIGYQTYNVVKDSMPKSWIMKKWNEGYYITSLTYGGGEWNVVMSKGTGISHQVYYTDAEYPKDWIREKWDKNYYINCVAYGNGYWRVVMSLGTKYSNQSWRKEESFPEDWFKRKNELVTDNVNTNPVSDPVNTPVNNTYTEPTSRPDPTLHVIIVANTLDASIGQGCEVDKNKLSAEFDNIGEALNIPVKKTIIYGADFKEASVRTALSNLYVKSNDIVVFFYRGHGFRTQAQTSRFPSMHLVHSQWQAFQSMELEDVYNIIKAKGARLNLVFGDLCNSYINAPQLSQQTNTFMQTNFYPDVNKLKKLFLNAEGSLIAAAASPGEVSWVHPITGGLFTSSFFESLYKEVGTYSGDGDWSTLLSNTISKAEYKSSYGCTTAGGKACDAQHGIKSISVSYPE